MFGLGHARPPPRVVIPRPPSGTPAGAALTGATIPETGPERESRLESGRGSGGRGSHGRAAARSSLAPDGRQETRSTHARHADTPHRAGLPAHANGGAHPARDPRYPSCPESETTGSAVPGPLGGRLFATIPGDRIGRSNQANQANQAAMPSRQALELLQVRQIRSPGQELRNSSRHLRHLRSFGSYVRSGSGLEFFSELLMTRLYSNSSSEMRYFFCAAHNNFFGEAAPDLDRVHRDRAPVQGPGSFRFER